MWARVACKVCLCQRSRHVVHERGKLGCHLCHQKIALSPHTGDWYGALRHAFPFINSLLLVPLLLLLLLRPSPAPHPAAGILLKRIASHAADYPSLLLFNREAVGLSKKKRKFSSTQLQMFQFRGRRRLHRSRLHRHQQYHHHSCPAKQYHDFR